MTLTPTMTATSTPPPYSDSFIYDDYGRLSQKGGSNYAYDPQHPHAVQSALGWVYTYNQSGGVVSKANNIDTTYTFTYTETLKVETVSLNGLELHHFGYDASGARVSEMRSDGTLVFFVGEYYEYSVKGMETHEKKYYGREAMREDGTLYFILTDHLGSTSVVTDENGNYLWEMRYDAWGAMRYTSGTLPTEKLYTGQRFSADLGIYDYKARWYDPLVGRFLMEDPIIPQQGVMRLERYAYAMNNPAFYVDPSGNKACDEIDENGKCIEDPQWHPRPDRLKVDELTTCKVKSDCVSGHDLYRFYLQVWHNKNGWWWSNGIFTIWDFMENLWSKEIASFAYGLHSGFHGYAEAMSRHAHDKQYFNCDPSQAECSLNFLAAYSWSAGAYYLTGSIDPSYPPTSYSHYLIAAIRDPSRIGYPEWSEGRVNDRPFDVGNASLDYQRAKDMVAANYMFFTSDPPGAVTERTALVLTYCESKYFHGEYDNFNVSGCILPPGLDW